MPPPLITNENPVNPLIPPGPPIRVQSTGVRPAVDALSDTGASAVLALHTSGGTAVFAASDAAGVGIEAHGGRLAGLFKGNMEVTGNITLTGPTSDITLTNEDCAEQFNVFDGSAILPGTVMVLDDDGLLRPSQFAYDKRVAGVISGAGSFRSAMTLGVRSSVHNRVPIALLGKVYCWADADIQPIEVGDLLTSSATEGHAMAATESSRAFGTIIGKALQPLASGRALIPILVALQ